MHFPTISLAMLLPTLAFAGSAIVQNNCNETVYVYSTSSVDGPKNVLTSGSIYFEQFRYDPRTGIAIKITTQDNPNGPGVGARVPQLNFQYSLTGQTVWIDASDVFGDPFDGKSITIKPSDGSGRAIKWPGGVRPYGTQPVDYSADKDIKLTLCG